MTSRPRRPASAAERRALARSLAALVAPRPATPLEVAALVLAGGGLGLWLTHGPVWPLTLFANVAHVLALGALAVLPLALLRGGRRRAAFCTGLVAMAGLVSALRWGPASPTLRADQPAAVALRVLTYNLGTDLAVGRELVDGLRASGADLIALQELSDENAELLDAELADLYPHRVLYPGGIPGRGLFSRHPITSHDWLQLAQARRHLICRVDVGGREVDVWVLHLSMQVSFFGGASSAGADLEELLERARGGGPAILCGDFNTTERSAEWRRVRDAGFEDAFRSAASGPGFTFPVAGRYLGIPSVRFVRIDYVWHSPELAAAHAEVGPDLGSDHRPVVADLRWR